MGIEHNGAYFGIGSRIKDFPVSIPLDCPEEKTMELANTPTPLKALDSDCEATPCARRDYKTPPWRSDG